jgi:SPP1 gp7 family putative phage head morphogenesis protein
MLHVKIDNEPIKAALTKIYTDGFLLGLDASKEAIGQEVRKRKAESKAANPYKDELLDMAQGDGTDYVDWANWKPGNRAAALLYRPTGAFEKILADAGIVSKNIAKAGYDRIGTALADSIAAGFSPGRAAKIIALKVSDPARALTIAVTEQNRAMSLASMQNYKNYGVEKVEWSGANPCDLCAPNEGQVVALGEEFESGDTEPPVHPNCRCALLPVINEEFDAEPNTSGVDDVMPREQAAPASNTPAKPVTREEAEKMQREARDKVKATLTAEELAALKVYKGNNYDVINRYLREGEISFGRGLKPERLQARLAEVNPVVTNARAAIEKSPGITQPIIVYRGVQRDFGNELWKYGVGSEYEDKGFVSTSFSAGITRDFGSTRLEITLPAGTKGLAIDGLIPRGESEFLLQSGTKFRVIEKVANPKDAISQYDRVIKVEVIP